MVGVARGQPSEDLVRGAEVHVVHVLEAEPRLLLEHGVLEDGRRLGLGGKSREQQDEHTQGGQAVHTRKNVPWRGAISYPVPCSGASRAPSQRHCAFRPCRWTPPSQRSMPWRRTQSSRPASTSLPVAVREIRWLRAEPPGPPSRRISGMGG